MLGDVIQREILPGGFIFLDEVLNVGPRVREDVPHLLFAVRRRRFHSRQVRRQRQGCFKTSTVFGRFDGKALCVKALIPSSVLNIAGIGAISCPLDDVLLDRLIIAVFAIFAVRGDEVGQAIVIERGDVSSADSAQLLDLSFGVVLQALESCRELLEGHFDHALHAVLPIRGMHVFLRLIVVAIPPGDGNRGSQLGIRSVLLLKSDRELTGGMQNLCCRKRTDTIHRVNHHGSRIFDRDVCAFVASTNVMFFYYFLYSRRERNDGFRR